MLRIDSGGWLRGMQANETTDRSWNSENLHVPFIIKTICLNLKKSWCA